MGPKCLIGMWGRGREEGRKRIGTGKRSKHWQKCKRDLFTFQVYFTVWGLSHVPVRLPSVDSELWLSHVLIGRLPWRKAKRFSYTTFLSHLEAIYVTSVGIWWLECWVWEMSEESTSTLRWLENTYQASVFSISKEQAKSTPRARPTLPNPQS